MELTNFDTLIYMYAFISLGTLMYPSSIWFKITFLNALFMVLTIALISLFKYDLVDVGISLEYIYGESERGIYLGLFAIVTLWMAFLRFSKQDMMLEMLFLGFFPFFSLYVIFTPFFLYESTNFLVALLAFSVIYGAFVYQKAIVMGFIDIITYSDTFNKRNMPRLPLYSLVVPLVLSIGLYAASSSSLLDDFKFGINNVAKKTMTVLEDTKSTEFQLISSFKKEQVFYRTKINEYFKDEANQIAAMNYLYYFNKRNLAVVQNDMIKDREVVIKEVLKYDDLMRIEFQTILDTFGKTSFSLIKLYKGVNKVNEYTGNISYTLVMNNYKDYNSSDYMGSDINYTASKTLLF